MTRNYEEGCNCYGVSAENLVCDDCGCVFYSCRGCKTLSPSREWMEEHEEGCLDLTF